MQRNKSLTPGYVLASSGLPALRLFIPEEALKRVPQMVIKMLKKLPQMMVEMLRKVPQMMIKML